MKVVRPAGDSLWMGRSRTVITVGATLLALAGC
jgi:hypothetical protein